ncbi:class I SAM-dependent methyltransferase [Undibacterium oligocarboniphilum]|uniref:Class I SAM-dependent methyltransferase n=1 Tax=Undibacterium oligocarboniphilum TaxID=666702 RepID=A0A850QK95_9BURK|nr:class I SAM-dependent methyltransferase [Undibacterium oligocarboniphilum]MBC3869587.1 class I SAM-dependent methyltransferase [Undibacterium oligocarboniphilum]NVO77965.1 class I SAM-dependent methyltransferase [Undibacterium oligocarboniphilum]
MTQFANTFAERSDEYVQARPRYPRAFYDWMLQNVYTKEQVWDCATGNGQAAVDLAKYFSVVQATDISSEQVSQGLEAPNIVYSAQPAEKTIFKEKQFDLITVAQALHWFDYSKFWTEVKRVAKPDAFFCAWGYAWFDCDKEIFEQFVMPLREIVSPYWAANNKILWDGYASHDVSFPFKKIEAPEFSIEEKWSINQLIGYLQTWSSYKRALQDEAKCSELTNLISSAKKRFSQYQLINIDMPIAVVAGRIL